MRHNDAQREQSTGSDPKRGDLTRERLIIAAIDVFGHSGFDGATTRVITERAQANIQAISYYFGSKEGLYLATVDYLADVVADRTRLIREHINQRLDELDATGDTLPIDEARVLLKTFAGGLLALFVKPDSEPWARFIIREQMDPTAAFETLYEKLIAPLLLVISRLMSVLLDQPDLNAKDLRMRAIAFMGSLLIFRFGRATFLAEIGQTDLRETDSDAFRRLVSGLVDDIKPTGVRP